MGYAYGIDLGTTHSCIARVNEKYEIDIIKNMEGDDLTPSVVEIISPTEFVVGKTAKRSPKKGSTVVECVKHRMGKKDYDNYRSQGVEITPEKISAEILKKVVKDAEKTVHEKIKNVVISVPWYFGDAERVATIAAGKEAGLNVLCLVSEPAAAAFAYSKRKGADERDKIVMVYDLGGGTFDITIAETSKDYVEIKCGGGDHNLGGKNWNEELAEYAMSEFCRQTGVEKNEIKDNIKFNNALNREVEEAKKDLSLPSKNSTTITLSWNDKEAEIEITKEKFDDITRCHLSKTIEIAKEVLKDAANLKNSKGIPCNKLDEILLVGGSTRMRQIEEALVKEFGIEPVMFEPDLAVAKGAALRAQRFDENPVPIPFPVPIDPQKRINIKEYKDIAKQIGIIDVTTKSYGIETKDKWSGKMILSNIILKNTPIPCQNTRNYSPLYANQPYVEIVIYESDLLELNYDLDGVEKKDIEQTELPLPPNFPADGPIEVTFKIDANRILTATAVELINHTSRVVQINLNRIDKESKQLLR
jgi:molecular chaperone DnaK (HSP70)